MKRSAIVVVPFTLAAVVGLGAVTFPGIGETPGATDAQGSGTETAASSPPMTATPAKLENVVMGPPLALSTGAAPSGVQTPNFEPVLSSPSPSDVPRSRFEVGDKLKIIVYERIEDVEQNKWGRDGGGLSGFQQRPEFGGEYNVEGDGTITLPLLGQFSVADRATRDLERAIATSFQDLTARPGLVTIVSVERPPIYVLGPVKNPGTYKFTPGMTVLHAIALAGGFAAPPSDPWRQLEAIKAAGNRRASLQLLPTLLARLAVLKAERDGATPEPTADLLRLTGNDVAEALVAKEVDRRRGIVAARQTERDTLGSALTMAKKNLQQLAKLQQPLDELIALRKERADSMKRLAQKGTIGREVLIQAQGDLTDAMQRRQEASNQLANTAQHDLTAAQQDIARFEADTKTTLQNEITALDQQITTMDGDAATNLDVLNVLQPVSYTQRADAGQTQYKVVRLTSRGPVEITASGLSALQPGDLVKIEFQDVQNSNESPPSSASTQPSSTILIGDSPP